MEYIQYQRGAIDAGGCVSTAWELVKRNLGMYVGVGLVTLIFISCIPFVNFFLLGPIMGGFAYLVLRDLRDEPIEFGMLFKGFEKFVPLMVLGLIQAIPGIIFQIFQYTVDIASILAPPASRSGDFYQAPDPLGPLQGGLVGWFIVVVFGYLIFQAIWNAALTFALPLVIEKDVPIGEAITLSLGATFSNLGGLIVLVLLNALVGILGMLALCVGIFVAWPVSLASYVVAYRHVFPYTGGPAAPEPGPPPPDAYNFGQGM